MDLWGIQEVIEGECRGKFILQSVLGDYAQKDGEILFFKSREKAQKTIDKYERRRK